ncbi:MAG: hypothetical protein ACD_62C00660G0001 [uncultured bacterium]|nr:MAG: hypothetical protein ACD_62C00660G0001 [uncultured bacterium]
MSDFQGNVGCSLSGVNCSANPMNSHPSHRGHDGISKQGHIDRQTAQVNSYCSHARSMSNTMSQNGNIGRYKSNVQSGIRNPAGNNNSRVPSIGVPIECGGIRRITIRRHLERFT